MGQALLFGVADGSERTAWEGHLRAAGAAGALFAATGPYRPRSLAPAGGWRLAALPTAAGTCGDGRGEPDTTAGDDPAAMDCRWAKQARHRRRGRWPQAAPCLMR